MTSRFDSIRDTYRKATKRLLLLDYDGTLANFNPVPSAAKPTKHLLAILTTLSSDPKNTVVIISGRDKDTLYDWLGSLNLAFVAEHGSFLKLPGQDWTLDPQSDAWKKDVRLLLEASASAVSGSFIEEKATALVWHYRNATGRQATAEAKRLLDILQPIATQHDIVVVPGNKIVEVRPKGVTKGSAATQWIKQDTWDFILAAGDDTTDEDLFAAMPEQAFTIKVGPGKTKADLRLADPEALRTALESLPPRS